MCNKLKIYKLKERVIKMKLKTKEGKGITLIALAVTILILLILAGVTIATLTGENGIIKNAGNAKEQAEIDAEKEIIETSVVQAIGRSKWGDLDKDEFQNQLDKNIGSADNKAKVYEEDNGFDVLFISNR